MAVISRLYSKAANLSAKPAEKKKKKKKIMTSKEQTSIFKPHAGSHCFVPSRTPCRQTQKPYDNKNWK